MTAWSRCLKLRGHFRKCLKAFILPLNYVSIAFGHQLKFAVFLKLGTDSVCWPISVILMPHGGCLLIHLLIVGKTLSNYFTLLTANYHSYNCDIHSYPYHTCRKRSTVAREKSKSFKAYHVTYCFILLFPYWFVIFFYKGGKIFL